jgi:hypothetical protein
MDTMYFSWLPVPVDYNDNLELPQFRLIDVLLVDCSKNYTTGGILHRHRYQNLYLHMYWTPSLSKVSLNFERNRYIVPSLRGTI